MVAAFAGARIRQAFPDVLAFQEVYMNSAEVLDVGRDAIWLTLQLCAPVLIVGLLVGVGIGLLQALTQIQEATLVFAPKIVAIFVSLLIFLPLMGALLNGFMRHIAARIASL
jgi:flagellar biosynthetic protein FliQ